MSDFRGQRVEGGGQKAMRPYVRGSNAVLTGRLERFARHGLQRTR